MEKWLVFMLVLGFAVAEKSPYRPSGWRPDGRAFDPAARLRSYGPPPPSNSYGPQSGFGVSTSTVAPFVTTTTTTETPTTTTQRSREPTTPFDDDDQVANGPALAVANSFAFNRPVYVYNTFPYYSAYTVLKR